MTAHPNLMKFLEYSLVDPLKFPCPVPAENVFFFSQNQLVTYIPNLTKFVDYSQVDPLKFHPAENYFTEPTCDLYS